eukprot:scaffold103624_cov56-Attheya_sp.AAC.3
MKGYYSLPQVLVLWSAILVGLAIDVDAKRNNQIDTILKNALCAENEKPWWWWAQFIHLDFIIIVLVVAAVTGYLMKGAQPETRGAFALVLSSLLLFFHELDPQNKFIVCFTMILVGGLIHFQEEAVGHKIEADGTEIKATGIKTFTEIEAAGTESKATGTEFVTDLY